MATKEEKSLLNRLLQQGSPPEGSAYYRPPANVNQAWQIIPGGSFAPSTAESGIYRTQMPDRKKGFLGGYSNVGSQRIDQAPSTGPAYGGVSDRDKERAQLYPKVLKSLGGSDDVLGANSSADTIKQAAMITDKLLGQQSQAPVEKRKPWQELPGGAFNMQDPVQREGWFRGGWNKEEINSRQQPANRKAAEGYVSQMRKAKMTPDEMNAFLQEVHPDVRREMEMMFGPKAGKPTAVDSGTTNKPESAVKQKSKWDKSLSSGTTRTAVSNGASKAIADRPLTGKGFGDIKTLLNRVPGRDMSPIDPYFWEKPYSKNNSSRSKWTREQLAEKSKKMAKEKRKSQDDFILKLLGISSE